MKMRKLDKKLNNLIPGGAHTYSRGIDQFPDNAPEILKKAKGCYTFDIKNTKYLDYGMALRSVLLGYSHKKINNAAIKSIHNGNSMTRPSDVELEFADLIKNEMSLDMVKFAKNSSNAVTAATKLARAYTGRSIILRCLDHPFFSFDDWFIGSTQIKKGIPKDTQRLTKTFNYNDIQSLKKNISKYKDKIACVVMEAVTFQCPKLKSSKIDELCCGKYKCERNYKKKNFLSEVQKLCRENQIVFIIDETITGFRLDYKGAISRYNLKPDLVIYGKAIANGFSVAVLGGKRKIMSLGAIDKKNKERVFLLSSTHGAEMSSLSAACETLKILKKNRNLVYKNIWEHGRLLIQNINAISKKLELFDDFKLFGLPPSPYFYFGSNPDKASFIRTFISKELIKDKILMPWISVSYAHKNKELKRVVESFKRILPKLKEELRVRKNYKIKNSLKPVFRKYN